MTFVVGLDLGQAQDYTAVAVLERIEPPPPQPSRVRGWGPRPTEEEARPTYHCRHLERLPLGTPYPAVARHVRNLLTVPALGDAPALAVDATGVGRPVVDLLREHGLEPVSVTITGGDVVVREPPGWRVPKRELVSAVQVQLQTGRLKFAERLPLVPVLVRELLAFRVKISELGHDSYGAWREGSHDDLVLALAVAVWWGERWRAPDHHFQTIKASP